MHRIGEIFFIKRLPWVMFSDWFHHQDWQIFLIWNVHIILYSQLLTLVHKKRMQQSVVECIWLGWWWLHHLTRVVDDACADAAKIVGQLHNVNRLELLFFHPAEWNYSVSRNLKYVYICEMFIYYINIYIFVSLCTVRYIFKMSETKAIPVTRSRICAIRFD